MSHLHGGRRHLRIVKPPRLFRQRRIQVADLAGQDLAGRQDHVLRGQHAGTFHPEDEGVLRRYKQAAQV